jgi:hypothetical protein
VTRRAGRIAFPPCVVFTAGQSMPRGPFVYLKTQHLPLRKPKCIQYRRRSASVQNQTPYTGHSVSQHHQPEISRRIQHAALHLALDHEHLARHVSGNARGREHRDLTHEVCGLCDLPERSAAGDRMSTNTWACENEARRTSRTPGKRRWDP